MIIEFYNLKVMKNPQFLCFRHNRQRERESGIIQLCRNHSSSLDLVNTAVCVCVVWCAHDMGKLKISV